MADVRLLGISGSIRKGSFNTMVLKTLRERLASAVELTLFDIGRLPHYKNAIDWGSRPAFRSVMKAKPMAFMTASMSAIGGARAQSQIREALLSTLAEVVNGPEVIITLVHEKVQDGRLVDEAALRFALDAVARLTNVIRQRSPVPA